PRPPPRSPLYPYTTLFRSEDVFDTEHGRRVDRLALEDALDQLAVLGQAEDLRQRPGRRVGLEALHGPRAQHQHAMRGLAAGRLLDRKSTRLNSSHVKISYA